VDEVYARTHKTKIGDKIDLKGQEWRVCGIVESGKLARMFVPIRTLQPLSTNTGKISSVYIKLDSPANAEATLSAVREKLVKYQVLPIEQMMTLFAPENVPLLAQFI